MRESPKLLLPLLLLAAALMLVKFAAPIQTPNGAASWTASTAIPERVQVAVLKAPATNRQLASLPTETLEDETMLKVYDHRTEKVMNMPLEQYITCAVAAEMPASFEVAALQAQAVAARSYICWKLPRFGGNGCAQAEGADICTQSDHCMAFDDAQSCRDKWGEDFDANWQKISQAVLSTQGIVAAYGGKPIHALFHSNSGGQTEDALAVFNMNLPYLSSVPSLGEEQASRYREQKTIALTELVQSLNKALPKANLSTKNIKEGLRVLARTPSGRVDRIAVGGLETTGKTIRTALGLNSTNFTISYSGDQAIFTTFGYGHGVGMSQAGANAMAQEGSSYEEILRHYYTDISLEHLVNLE